MKKTLLTLFVLTTVSYAATDMIYWAGTTGNDILTIDTAYNNMPYLGRADGGSRMGTGVISTLTTANNADYNLHFKETGGAASFAVNNSINLHSIYTTDKANDPLKAYTIAFGENGSINTEDSINWGSNLSSLTLSVTLSSDEASALAAGNDVFRTLITTDHMAGTPSTKLPNALTLGTFTGADLKDGGVIYAIKAVDGNVTSYYNLDSISITAHDGNNYVSVKEGADSLTLDAGTAYLVISGTAASGAAMKQISYLATAPVPEPTTATLSLLALAGLAARRRRK